MWFHRNFFLCVKQYISIRTNQNPQHVDSPAFYVGTHDKRRLAPPITRAQARGEGKKKKKKIKDVERAPNSKYDPIMHRDCPLDCKVYVGNLGNNGNKSELERAFGYYGPLRSVWVARNPPGFAFVEFEDPRDATDAVRELDGRTLCGCRVRVELSNGEKRSRNRGPPPSWSRRPRDDYRRRSPPPRRRVHHHASFSATSESVN
ncbi:hypothetical protein AMELA_G00002420 [Ameiurus melas]|uniref:Serine/arginine-rich splicing factor 3 n=2 Tax=Siluroidei TaxID=1489793 RepID=A0A7J6BF13_AMEME|nr:hypothetical protein AMELA_G00002420 [Ameiurus melas]